MILALFDVDGTLVDAGGSGRWALSRAFERVFGVKGMEALAADVPFDGRTDTWIVSAMASRAGLDPERLEACRESFEAAYLDMLRGRLDGGVASRPLPGVIALLDGLGEREILLGLVTGNIRMGARIKLEAAGVGEYFDCGAYGDDSADRVELARLARLRFESRTGRGIEPSEVLLVGDSRQDVRAARANGYRSLAVGTGWTSLEDLSGEGPDRLLEDLQGTEELLAWITGRA